MLPINPYFRSCLFPSGFDEMVLKIELMTASSVHHDFIKITISCLRDGSASAHGNGYLDNHRLTTPASSAAGMSSWMIRLSVFNAFFSPMGLVFGRIGDIVVQVSSLCSSRKLHRHSTRALYVAISRNRAHTEVLETKPLSQLNLPEGPKVFGGCPEGGHLTCSIGHQEVQSIESFIPRVLVLAHEITQ